MRAVPAWLLAAALAAATASGEPPVAVFRPESLAIQQRHPVGGIPVPDHRLVLVADMPRDLRILRLLDPRFAPAAIPGGERLGLLVRPANRVQNVVADRQSQRDRAVRLTLEVTPPRQTSYRLIGISGTVEAVCGLGQPQLLDIDAVAANGTVFAAGADPAAVRLDDPGDADCALLFSAAMAERIANVSFLDAAGAAVAAKSPKLRPLDGGAVRATWDFEEGRAATVRISWFAELRTVSVPISIPLLEIPGGIPGIGDASAPLQAGKRPAPATPLARAAAAGDAAAAIALIDQGADPLVRGRDGTCALDHAAMGGSTEVAGLFIARTPPGAAAGLQGPSGLNPLHHAASAGAAAAIPLLMAWGVDPWQRAKDGRSAIDLARDLGQWQVLRLLLGNPPDAPDGGLSR